MTEVKEETIKVRGKNVQAKLQYFDKSDMKDLQKIYNAWKNLDKKIRRLLPKYKSKTYGRTSNIPDILTEGAFAYFRKCPRLVGNFTKSKSSKAKKLPSSSADCYDKKNKKTVQVKASSTGKNGKCNDLTSFGPKSEFDKLYFLDFYRKGKRDGKFDVYDIPIGFLYKTKVKKNMTLEQRAKKEGKGHVFQ